MKYEYKNATGITEIEIDEHFYELLIAMDNEEKNSNRRHGRNSTVSLDNCEYEGEWFNDGTDLLADLIHKESYSRLRAALKELRPEQQALIERVYFQKEKIVDIAAKEGVSHAAVIDRLRRIYAKINRNLE